MNLNNYKIAYFGGEPLGVPVLKELKNAGILPSLIISSTDRKQGRKMLPTSPPVKTWAKTNKISTFQPENFKDKKALTPLIEEKWDLFVVVAYNAILPEWLIETPLHKTINLHPSLLPRYRGPSPIRSIILDDARTEVGLSVMLMDKDMDHGPILAQQKVEIAQSEWPIRGSELDNILSYAGGKLLSELIPKWIHGEINPKEQEHDKATYTKKITKSMGEIMINPHNLPKDKEAYLTLLKIRAYDKWPQTFFFYNEKRIKIVDAKLTDDGNLDILTVIPEGKKEIKFKDFLSSI